MLRKDFIERKPGHSLNEFVYALKLVLDSTFSNLITSFISRHLFQWTSPCLLLLRILQDLELHSLSNFSFIPFYFSFNNIAFVIDKDSIDQLLSGCFWLPLPYDIFL